MDHSSATRRRYRRWGGGFAAILTLLFISMLAAGAATASCVGFTDESERISAASRDGTLVVVGTVVGSNEHASAGGDTTVVTDIRVERAFRGARVGDTVAVASSTSTSIWREYVAGERYFVSAIPATAGTFRGTQVSALSAFGDHLCSPTAPLTSLSSGFVDNLGQSVPELPAQPAPNALGDQSRGSTALVLWSTVGGVVLAVVLALGVWRMRRRGR